MDFLSDLWFYMKERKKFWLAPVIIILLLIGVLIVFGGSSAVAPFIYTLFQHMSKLKNDPVKTVLVITTGFLIVYLITDARWALIVASVIGIMGVFSGYLAAKINYLWMKLAWVLSLIIPNILLSAIFFFILFPLSVLSKIFGEKDPLHLKNSSGSLFKDKNKIFDKKSFEHPW